MKQALIAVSLALLTASAVAAPVYLECEAVEADGKTTTYKFTLNEEAQNTVLSDDSLTQGKSYTVPAQFTADKVLFKWPPLGNISPFVLQYEISRTTLEFVRAPNRSNATPVKGACKIATPVERKF